MISAQGNRPAGKHPRVGTIITPDQINVQIACLIFEPLIVSMCGNSVEMITEVKTLNYDLAD